MIQRQALEEDATKPPFDHDSTRWGMKTKRGQEDEADCELLLCEKHNLHNIWDQGFVCFTALRTSEAEK